MDFQLGLTFDDVLFKPLKGLNSRSDANLHSRISKNVKLNIPLVSSNMDTVTEDKMAIEMAREGGIGILHRFCSIQDQVNMVLKVKRAESLMIYDPYTVSLDTTIGEVRQLSKIKGVNSFLVVDGDKLLGILSKRDWYYIEDTELVSNHMTKDYIFGNKNMSMYVAKNIMIKYKIKRLPILYYDKLIGLICLKDLLRHETKPNANYDKFGRLVVGAAIGVKDDAIERATALINAGVDVLVIDVAHGHSDPCINTLKKVKELYPNVDVVAGNVATAEGALELIENGADGIKCGIGNGSICITRIVAGAGVPQLTALLDVYTVCKKYDIPIISDGGNRTYGNICKALAAGASCVMLGRMIAGTDESPTPVLVKDNKRVKMIRGMASLQANISNAIKNGFEKPNTLTFSSEGVEGYVPYIGPVKDILKQMCDGIRSGMSYNSARTIDELQKNRVFIRVTHNGNRESGVHDITQI